MKIYQVVDGREYTMTEEDVVYFGTDFEAAKEEKQRLIEHNDAYLTEREKSALMLKHEFMKSATMSI